MGKAALAALIVLAIAAAPARADTVAPGTSDAAGDCTASPCADMTSVGLSMDRFGTLAFHFTGVGYWFDFNDPSPQPVPQIWIWTTSPDTGPPDATITASGAHIAGGPTFIVRTENAVDPDVIGATQSLNMEAGEGSNDIPGFLTALGGPFRWRAALPADPNAKLDAEHPVDPHPADVAPDSGTIAFNLPDKDSDGMPDAADPCPTEPFSTLNAPGWSVDEPRDGCSAPVAPFAAKAFKNVGKKAAKALRALWRNHARRAQAMSKGRIDVRLRVPGHTRGLVQASVVLAHPDGPRPQSAFGRHRCTGGKACLVPLRLISEGVRAYRHKALHLVLSFSTGSGSKQLRAQYVAALRMPLG